MPRLGSALVFAAIAGLALWFGGVWFAGLIVVIIAAMLWELGSMLTAGSKLKTWIITVLAAITIIATSFWGILWVSIALLLISAGLQRVLFVEIRDTRIALRGDLAGRFHHAPAKLLGREVRERACGNVA